MAEQTVRFRIKRQEHATAPARWEDFVIPYRPGMNVISALMAIQKRPVTAEGKQTSPPVWEASCLEEVCGACTMVVNGQPRQACTALIDQYDQPITLEPMSKFPLVRDLIVDRSRMFNNLKKVKAWIPIDGTYDLGPGPRMSQEKQEETYPLSRCMTCGVCLEVCPQFGPHADFMGAQAINAVRLFNAHPTGAMNADERLEAITGKGGIQDCGNAQNCVRACPKEIPLTASIADVNRQATKFMFKKLLRK